MKRFGYFYGKYPKTTLVLVNLIFFVLLCGIIEIGLKFFAPYQIATIGHVYSKNASLYGWGYNPYEYIRILDPDTGETYISKANNHGWRDKERHYVNKTNAYRILVLGDSMTYGAIVPAEKAYTRIPEEALQKMGYNIEVINISYGAWGTDQELEALINEGIKFHPHLIIVQFCSNDLSDNAYYHHAIHNDGAWKNLKAWKPFYYELDQNNVLHRKENPFFRQVEAMTLRERINMLMSSTEIFKRLYGVYIYYSLREVPSGREGNHTYRVSENQIRQLQEAIGLSEDSALYKYLHGHIGMNLPAGELCSQIDSSPYAHSREIIYRVLEDRLLHQLVPFKAFNPVYADAESYEWRLYFALIDAIKKQAESIRADVAIFPETEEGHYQWELSWYRVKNDAISKTNYLSHIPVIRAAMKDKGIDVIENTVPYQRARNDHHPNIQGNETMAADILRYLLLRENALAAYKEPSKPAH